MRMLPASRLIGVGALACVVGCSRASNDSPASGSPTPPPVATTYEAPRPPPPAAPKPNEEPRSPFHEGLAIQAADPTHVDPVEMLQQARKIALGLDEHAVLTSISALKGMTAGTVDVTGDEGVTYQFEWLYFDKSRPPGSDKVENGLWISARRGRFSVTELHRAIALSRPTYHPDPGPTPRCSARDAWMVAVRSGMPENAVASMRYAAAFPGGPGQPYVWDFRVDGHDELRREINGATCAVWDRSKRSPRRR